MCHAPWVGKPWTSESVLLPLSLPGDAPMPPAPMPPPPSQ